MRIFGVTTRLALLISPGTVLAFSPLPRVSSTHSSTLRNTEGDESRPTSTFNIERVESRERFYDLSVFRYRNTPLEDYMADNNHISKDEALMLLTSTKCDDTGQDLWFSGPKVGVLTQFAAFSVSHDLEELQGTRGVVGSVDVLLREINGESTSRTTRTAELRNLSVHPSFRRKGIASCLVDAVQAYAQGLKPSAVLYLHVALDNHGARALYERKGFQADPSDLERMVWDAEVSSH